MSSFGIPDTSSSSLSIADQRFIPFFSHLILTPPCSFLSSSLSLFCHSFHPHSFHPHSSLLHCSLTLTSPSTSSLTPPSTVLSPSLLLLSLLPPSLFSPSLSSPQLNIVLELADAGDLSRMIKVSSVMVCGGYFTLMVLNV